MSILLISVQDNMEVIGLKSLHYALLGAGEDSSLLFLPRLAGAGPQVLDAVARFVAERKPGLVGVSLMSTEFHAAAALTARLKSSVPDIPVVWGGIHPTIAPEQCLGHADYVCVGEGEGAVREIARAAAEGRDLRAVSNLCYREGERIVKNPLAPLIRDLDALPATEHVPRESFVLDAGRVVPLDRGLHRKYDRYAGTVYSIMSSRGCPFSCTYCCNNFINQLYHTHQVRRRGSAGILAELERAVAADPEIQQVNFQDDCFLACTDAYLEEFCAGYRERVGRPFIIRSIPVYITAAKLRILKDAGVAWISIGLQSGSDRVNRDVYKRRSLRSDFLRAARLIREHDIAAMYDVILDNPFENEEDRLETVETLMETPKPFYPQFFSLTLYLGTELYERARREAVAATDDYLDKPYYLPADTPLNDLARAAVYLPAGVMRRLVALYRSDPRSAGFRRARSAAKLLVIALEPLSSLRVLRLSQGGSLIRTLRVLPGYFREGLRRFFWQFRAAAQKGGRGA